MPIKPRKLASALIRAGADVVNKRSGSGHKVAIYRGRKADIPFHGGGYEVSDRLFEIILKQLGMTRDDLDL